MAFEVDLLTRGFQAAHANNALQQALLAAMMADDEGYAVVKNDGEVPEDLRDKAQLAVDNCPEFALSLEED